MMQLVEKRTERINPRHMVITIKGVVGGQTASPPPTVSVLLPSPDFTPPTPTQTGSETPGPGLWCLCVPVPTRPPRGRCWYDGGGGLWYPHSPGPTSRRGVAMAAWGSPFNVEWKHMDPLPVLAVSLCSLQWRWFKAPAEGAPLVFI